MDTKQLTKEKQYLVSMHFIREMFLQGVITKSEYIRAELQVRTKYSPIIGQLLTDSDLL